MIGIKFDHLGMAVADWEKTSDFYRLVLEAEIVERGPGLYAFRWGANQINVVPAGSKTGPPTKAPFVAGAGDMCWVWPGTPEQAAAHLEKNGVPLEAADQAWRTSNAHSSPMVRFGGRGNGTSIFFRDPEGSCLEFICYG